jgi:uncharacterized membrane protein AbrB (regulator of aidB expression)
MDYSQLIPAAALAAVFGLTEAVKRFVTPAGAEPPRWFLFVPVAFGLIVGTAFVLSTLTPADAALSNGIIAWKCVYTGLGFAGAAVLAWEAKKKVNSTAS